MQDDIKPWTIKNIPPEDRNAAISAAERERMSIGEWMCRAIRSQVRSDVQQDRAPAVIAHGPAPQPATLDSIGRMIELAQTLATATGRPVPRSIAAPATRLLREHIRAAAKG